jgi:hypothetical protein
MGRNKQKPFRKIKHNPVKRGAYARYMANMIDNEGNNLGLLQPTTNRNYEVPQGQMPTDVRTSSVPKKPLANENQFSDS